jgi:hypothetical protein
MNSCRKKFLPRSPRRRDIDERDFMPRLELGVIMRIGRVPVVLGTLQDPRVVRDALSSAVEYTNNSDGRQVGLLRELLEQVDAGAHPVPM